MGGDADALVKRTLVHREGRLFFSVGLWYDLQKQRLLETEKAHHETMLAMMLLAQQSPQQSQPQPWLPVELWDMVALEFLPLQNPLYAMLTQNGTNEIVLADLHALKN